MEHNKARVVVIGGGYAGVAAANRLRRAELTITLVNSRPKFVERIRLHQLAVGNHGATVDYSGLLGSGVQLVVDAAERIDTAQRMVELASGRTLPYDYLIYAVGSGSLVADVPGVAEFAYPLSELEEAQRLAARLQDVPRSAPVVVIGGGLTGIEAAGEFAQAGRPVTLVGDKLGPSLAASGRKSVTKALRRLGVELRTGVRVSEVQADSVLLSDGSTLPSAVTVWTAGFSVPGLAAASGLGTDDLGRLRTDETLVSVSDPHVIAAGDAASPSDRPLRMSCQAAMPLGAQAAQTVLALVAGEQPAAIRQAFTGQCISVGREAGTVQLSRPDDSPRRAYLGGRIGALVKEQVCRFTVSTLRREARKPGAVVWLKSDWRDQAVRERVDV